MTNHEVEKGPSPQDDGRSQPVVRRARRGAAILVVAVGTVIGALSASACKKPADPGAAPASSASAGSSAPELSSAERASGGVPLAASAIVAALNPDGKAPYDGPFGDVEGFVTVRGDPPPDVPVRIPAKCGEAAASYRKLFRVGPKGELADAIVGITQYAAYVPAASEVRQVRIHGCAYDARTITLTYGERIEVINGDREPYLPLLDGAHLPAQLVAMPGGDPVRLYPPKPGRYTLTDTLVHPWMKVDTFVFKYPTHDVSAVDGHFHIARVPVGKVKLSVLHTAIQGAVEREVEVKANEVAHVNVELTFDAKTYVPPPITSSSTSPPGPRRREPK